MKLEKRRSCSAVWNERSIMSLISKFIEKVISMEYASSSW